MTSSSSQEGRLVIQVQGEDRAPTELPRQGRLVIGSEQGRVDLWIQGQGVDKVHCAIGRVKGGGWALQDLGSEFGSLLNGEAVRAKRVRSGDEILLGAVRLRVFDPSQAATSQSAPLATSQKPKAKKPKPSKAQASSAAPPKISGFTLSKPLGRGATGTVWLATQDSLDREVALKVLAPKLAADDAFVERFQAEARAAAALGHPNVVTVYDVGSADGQHFLAMEFMPGGCLESHLAAEGPLPWDEVLGILSDASAGLEYAESRGIVHRDIKPANLMRSEDGTVRIADLGLATSVESAVEMGASEGGKRRVQGTPHFLAPELIRGSPPGPRTDLYALGVTAYRLLAGRTPFDGSNSTEILKAALHATAPPLGELAPSAPVAIVELVQRLISRDPDERPASAAALRLEVQGILRESQSVAPAKVHSRGSGKWIAAVAILALGGALAFGLLRDRQSPESLPGDEDRLAGAAGAGSDPKAQTLVDPAEAAAGLESAFQDQPTPSEEEPKDDRAEQLFEERAELAYLRLGQLLLGDEERIERLGELAAQFQGSNIALKAEAEANGLRNSLSTRAQQEQAVQEARDAMLTTLRDAVTDSKLEGLQRPGRALRAVLAVPGQEDFAADTTFQAARGQLLESILEDGLKRVEGLSSQSQGDLDGGRFEAARVNLVALVGLVDIPELGAISQRAQGTLDRMRALAQEARNRLSAFESIQAERKHALLLADRAATASGFGGAKGLERELQNLDFPSARRRIEATLAQLSTEVARASMEPLLIELEQAELARQSLLQAWSSGGWRRKTILLPEDMGRSGEVQAIDASGLAITSKEALPWSKLMRVPRSVSSLFQTRLERSWSEEELAGIAVIVRLSCLLAVVEGANDSLLPRQRSRFTERKEEALLDHFRYAEEWLKELDGDQRLRASQQYQSERDAAGVLARALRATAEDRVVEAAALLARLLDEFDGTLLVRLLSDGTAWRIASQSPPPQAEESGQQE